MSHRPMTVVSSTVVHSTAAALLAFAGLHVAWGVGSTFPFRTREELGDAVIGRQVTPGPSQCAAVAGMLTVAAVAVERAHRRHTTLPRVVSAGVATTLAARATFGFAGRTDVLVPGSTSRRFRRLDRRVFSPICAALATGAALAALERTV